MLLLQRTNFVIHLDCWPQESGNLEYEPQRYATLVVGPLQFI